MGSGYYMGLFMDFNIYKITETKEDNNIEITYVANEIAGDYQYVSNYLEVVILKIIKRKYLNNLEILISCGSIAYILLRIVESL